VGQFLAVRGRWSGHEWHGTERPAGGRITNSTGTTPSTVNWLSVARALIDGAARGAPMRLLVNSP